MSITTMTAKPTDGCKTEAIYLGGGQSVQVENLWPQLDRLRAASADDGKQADPEADDRDEKWKERADDLAGDGPSTDTDPMSERYRKSK